METFTDFICGLVAGWSQIITGQPLDYLKTQSQLTNQKISFKLLRKFSNQIIQEHGVFGFYRGSSSLFFGFAFTIGIQFTGYQACKKYIMDNYYPKQMKTPEEALNLKEIFLSGAFIGFLVSFIFCPVEYMKIKRQTNGAITKGSFTLLLQQIFAGKISRVYEGYLPTLVRQTLGTAIYFSTYQGSVRYLCRWQEKQRRQAGSSQYFIGGGLAGFMFWTLVYPFDVIKTQKQKGIPYSQIIPNIHKMAFRGYGIMALRSVIVNCFSFVVFQYTKLLFKFNRSHN